MSTHLLYGCHQCSVALLCNAFSRNMCDRYDKCRLACNVCGGITTVLYGRSCDLCILGRSLFVDLSGSPGYRAVLAISWILRSSCLDYKRYICLSVCVGHKRRVYNVTPLSYTAVASARRSGQEDFQRGTPPVSLASRSISPFLRACIITE